MALLGGGARSRRSFAAMMHMVCRGGLRGVGDRVFELAQAGRTHEVAARVRFPRHTGVASPVSTLDVWRSFDPLSNHLAVRGG
jgi:hypothetical protein